MTHSLYIHIPFCKSRCVYCGFFSTTQLSQHERYVAALCREMRLAALPSGHGVDTIYLGGGTPSVLPVAALARILDAAHAAYNVSPAAEVTVECNPDDVTARPELVRLLAGGNAGRPLRVSMGAQTFSDGRLRRLGRRHTARQVTRAVEVLRGAGVENISLDLMYGFPGETLRQWDADVSAAIDLRPQHLSAYCLSYEEDTPLWRQLREGQLTPADEETERSMYYHLADRLADAGYEHYEISNFALLSGGQAVSPFRSRHNSGYWHDVPYVGLGAGAHEYSGSERRWNVADVSAYISAIDSGRRPQQVERLDAATRYDEAVMLRLRTREGLPLGLLTAEQRSYCLRQAAPFIASGLLRRNGDSLCLGRDALFVSDMVISSLMS